MTQTSWLISFIATVAPFVIFSLFLLSSNSLQAPTGEAWANASSSYSASDPGLVTLQK